MHTRLLHLLLAADGWLFRQSRQLIGTANQPADGWASRILRSRTLGLACLLLVVLWLPTQAQINRSNTRYVKAGGTGDGSSWIRASGDLQAMIDASGVEQVWVAAGRYRPKGDEFDSFSMRNGVAIYGGFAGDEISLNDRMLSEPSSTTLTGNNYNYHVIHNPPGLNNSAIVDGITITGGFAGFGNIKDGNAHGGGVYNDGSNSICNPTFRNCYFFDNKALVGGAMYNGGESSPTLINCSFVFNRVLDFYKDYGDRFPNELNGGAINNNENSKPILINCSFKDNTAANGGAMCSQGSISRPTLINCSFTTNTARLSGGAIWNDSNSGTTLTACSFVGNVATQQGGAIFAKNTSLDLTNCSFQSNFAESQAVAMGGEGGALFIANSKVNLANCSFYKNSAALRGGAVLTTGQSALDLTNCSFVSNFLSNKIVGFGGTMLNSNSTARLTNCSFQAVLSDLSRNANTDGIVLYNYDSNVDLTNSVFFVPGSFGDKTIVNQNGASVLARYCLFENSITGYNGTDNKTTSVSPFVSTTSTALSSCSPAINAGDPASTTVTSGSTDLVGNPRFFQGGRIDMGAYEFQEPSPFVAITGMPSSGTSVVAGATVTASVSTTGPVSSYQWYKENAPVNGQTSATLNLINVQPPDAGTYSVMVSSACNSVTSTAFSLSVIPPLLITELKVSPTSVCAGQNFVLSAALKNVSGIYSYTVTNGTTSFTGSANSPDFSQSVVTSESGVQSYSLLVSDANRSVSAQTDVTVNAYPNAQLTNSGPLSCTQTSVRLEASGGEFYRFSSGAVQVGSGPTASVFTTGLYTVTVTSGGGCSAVATTTVERDQRVPTVSLASSGPLSCSATSVTLTASGGSTYQFSAGATQLGSGPTATVTTTGVYSVTVTGDNGCSAIVQTLVNEDFSKPTASLGNDGQLSCNKTAVTLYASGGATYQFSPGATQIANGSTATVHAAGVYSVTVLATNGCSDVASITVTNDGSKPTASLISDGPLSCSKTVVTLFAAGGSTYQFSANANHVSNANTATVTRAGLYSVTVTSASGCSDVASLSVGQDGSKPTASLASDGSLSCSKTTATLIASGGDRYLFSSGATQIAGGNTATVSSAGVYSVTVLAANGCSDVASTTVTGNVNPPVATLRNDGPLNCDKPTVTLTASGGSTYLFGPGATSFTNGPIATVTRAGVYSVTVVADDGCSALASTTVTGSSSLAPPELNANTLATTNQPLSVTAQGCSGTIDWQPQGGTGSADGNLYTFNQPGNYTLTATCTSAGCTSPPSSALLLSIRPAGFAIIGVTMISCHRESAIEASRGQYSIQFTPVYGGQTNTPISFSVANELSSTTSPGPYALLLYSDNPVITLVASQSGNVEARYRYNWLTSCQSGTAPNQPPTTTGIPSQTVLQGQAYALALTSYFSDPDQQQLSFSATGLPAGLAIDGGVLGGTVSTTGVSSVKITAVDPGGLSVSSTFMLTVNPVTSTPTGDFTITGVTLVNCQATTTGQRSIRFLPFYGGASAEPIHFSVANELASTTAVGPYDLTLYTDNPTITLQAQQGSFTTRYRYNWLAACQAGQTPNQPPTTVGIADQSVQLGQSIQLQLNDYFADPEGQALTFTASVLPAGLTLKGALLTGTPITTGLTLIELTATDPLGLSVSSRFQLTVRAVVTQPADFTITSVSTLGCEPLSAGARRVRFLPQYSGSTGGPIQVAVVNEMAMTAQPGPYSLTLYTDNPVVRLTAQQGQSVASFSYNWLAGCASAARLGSVEQTDELLVKVLGNPVLGETVEVEIRGAGGQSVSVQLSDERGRLVGDWPLPEAGVVERLRLRVGNQPAGQFILRVNTALQSRTFKLLKTH